MTMRILHVADTHLGYSTYRKVDGEGLNQRWTDVCEAFREFVDFAVSPPDGVKVDAVLHAGDFFDSVRPSNRTLAFAIEQLLRLGRAGIKTIIISGNHETPKLKETGSVFRLFEHLPNVHPVYKTAAETIELGAGDRRVLVHAVPQCQTEEQLIKNLDSLEPVPGAFNILLAHGALTGIEEFRTGEFNEQILPSGYLSKGFDYVALGHYHKHVKVGEGAFYAGTLERLTFAEVDGEKGFIDIRISGDGADIGFVSRKTRPMVNLGEVDCGGLDATDVQAAVERRITDEDASGKILRIHLKNIAPAIYRNLDFRSIRGRAEGALHFELKYSSSAVQGEVQGGASIGSLEDEWLSFVERTAIESERERLVGMALHYLKGGDGDDA
ncbi:MAG: exonuclease SbcCD subunit D [Candidatus Anoxymicrobium japonicum]|uniref:Nuclease SbcCD subunit D n=1 Tax=Candidatus Anoxymicrobium japonicum TaxID=2013648 RepID=A0A2N3G5D7_9ACTN|nr:MAG: exonuclease SbcCD subunit D [Candidatus Anoxymicrobium japonicum]